MQERHPAGYYRDELFAGANDLAQRAVALLAARKPTNYVDSGGTIRVDQQWQSIGDLADELGADPIALDLALLDEFRVARSYAQNCPDQIVVLR